MRTITTLLLIPLAALVVCQPTVADACPFCTAVSQTFSEEIDSMDVVVIAHLIEAPPVPDAAADPDAPLPRAKFRIAEALKGDKWASASQTVEVLYFGEPNKDKRYLIMGTDPPQIMWSTPLSLSDRAYKYILALHELPKDPARLAFFQEYLEDEDEMLARDAYDEFANAPYADVKTLGPKMHHDRLLAWIKDTEIPASRRRLYFTMFSVCGQAKDADLLESFMKSDNRKSKSGLDAMIACYLTLKGEDGLELVEDLFLKNENAEYADTYAAIMAIRFHGTQTDLIDQKRLVRSLRYMLERPELADLVIPDLAKWQDWEIMPRLVQLFKDADEKSSWVRVPVINYLRACPLPKAKEHIEELNKIDPDAVKRAKTFFPFDPAGEAAIDVQRKDDKKTSMVMPVPAADSDGDQPAAARTPLLLVSHSNTVAQAPVPEERAEAAPPETARTVSDAGVTAVAQPWQPNLLQLWGVPILVGLALLGAYRFILGVPLTQNS